MSTIRLSNDFKFSKRKFSQNESSYRGINLWTSRSVDAADSMVQRMTVKCFLTISHRLASSGLLSISNIPSASPGKLLPAQVLTLLSAKRTCLRREKNPNIDKIFRIQTKSTLTYSCIEFFVISVPCQRASWQTLGVYKSSFQLHQLIIDFANGKWTVSK